MEKSDKNLNNYCMNCGNKLKKNAEVCPKCNTVVINKRVRIDNNYIFYLLFCMILTGAGFFLDAPVLFLVQYLVLCYCYNQYKNNIIVSILFWINTVPIMFFLLLLIILINTCGI